MRTQVATAGVSAFQVPAVMEGHSLRVLARVESWAGVPIYSTDVPAAGAWDLSVYERGKLVYELLYQPGSVVPAYQYARPSALDSASATWGASAGTIATATDEGTITPVDGDYAANTIVGVNGDNYIVSLNTVTDPGTDEGFILKVRCVKTTTVSDPQSLDCTVLQGAAVIAPVNFVVPYPSFNTLEYAIPSGFISLVTDFTALKLKVAKNGGNGVQLRVSATEIWVPGVGAGAGLAGSVNFFSSLQSLGWNVDGTGYTFADTFPVSRFRMLGGHEYRFEYVFHTTNYGDILLPFTVRPGARSHV